MYIIIDNINDNNNPYNQQPPGVCETAQSEEHPPGSLQAAAWSAGPRSSGASAAQPGPASSVRPPSVLLNMGYKFSSFQRVDHQTWSG